MVYYYINYKYILIVSTTNLVTDAKIMYRITLF